MSAKISSTDDTIAAIATPSGVCGLAVIRVSGEKSADIVANCITQSTLPNPHRAYYTHFIDPDSGEEIDEVVVTYFQKPKSFTAEDVVEISCHGGHYVAQKILNTLLKSDIRIADPGEFTKRAFLNGRIDLTQAEAVSDLISAQTSSSHKIALQQLDGRLKQTVSGIRERLIDAISLLELELDFSEEEIKKTQYSKIKSEITALKSQCEQLVDSYKNGKIYRSGIYAPIVGKPNAGKSSILNALLQEERALVSDIPGTTRDTIEEAISHNGVEIRLVDTAGLRESEDAIESMGVSRAEEVINQADVLLHIIDVYNDGEHEDSPGSGNAPVITIYNKIDLLETQPEQMNGNSIYTSATEMEGISLIGDRIIDMVLEGNNYAETSDTPVITNERHRKALEEAIASFNKAITSVDNRMSSEFIVLDLRGALDSLGLLTGETTTDDILNNIFEKFCIGK
ncbi:MAG: tRNA uridine-5-carboxymethylaminomethyl(34) synthesis GTPase MnmE [Candidatus Marinimicrobia bacterium]|nr:tRNA uridine-5-carboxymethylaminomethyl(34) synthesis GTPase MnmE [Candidatus Neomarinimicrobiota bacterium]MCF7829120.1 tRNA uridine-5-carboxymethylaminomethyl(34) synthesis GTPase MnmE [Candidatus Neomarinimicrobiota bacterium]MCF7881481.1 tRNA uridine-5-carboxymethylaminomethyl(34) synthesis GTPase MnmE [Candidatus Neomarinimicrobiota bacterium]